MQSNHKCINNLVYLFSNKRTVWYAVHLHYADTFVTGPSVCAHLDILTIYIFVLDLSSHLDNTTAQPSHVLAANS